MSRTTHSVKIKVAGEEYTIRSDAPPEHARAVAAHVDAVLARVNSAPAFIEPGRAAILAALQVADELLRERAASEELAADMTVLGDEVRRLLPPAKRASIGVRTSDAG